jgi:hypothetical protein
VFIDLDDSGARHELELPAPASLSSSLSDDGRFLFAAHDHAVSVVDGGAWSESHGDHAHHHVMPPVVLGQVDGEHPTHLISHDGMAALWFDGLGQAIVLDQADLEDGRVHEHGRVTTPAPHHGFAIVVDDDVVTTAPTSEPGGMPDTVVVTDRDDTVTSAHTCTQTHGEATWPGGVAVACNDGVVLLEERDDRWHERHVPYPAVDDTDPYGYGNARAWVLQPSPDGRSLIAPLGARHVLVVEARTGTARAIDMGVGIATFGLVFTSDDRLVVLGTDGAARVVDLTTGAASDPVSVTTPFEEGEDRPYRMLVASHDAVFVSDPDSRRVYEIATTGSLRVERTIELGFAPAFLGVLNA